MTGIAGVLDLRGERKIRPHVVAQMAAAIAHRGPDHLGNYCEQGLSLAVHALCTDDRHFGEQPAFSADNSVVAAFDGALYNAAELRADLASRGRQFNSNRDAEVVAGLWQVHGRDMLALLQGQFAIALFDTRRRALLLARDRVGKSPLHWARRGDFIYFGSEIKAILASGEVDAEVDPRGIDHVFTFVGMGTRRTAFRDIWSLPPAGWLEVELRDDGLLGEVREGTYWDLDFPNHGDERRDRPEVLQEEFETLLTSAVRRSLTADVPVASYLSGGVDSTTVLHTAAKILGHAPPCFTIKVDEGHLDESGLACQVARSLGEEPTIVHVAGSDIARAYPDLVLSAELPVMNTACAALYKLAESASAQGIRATLTGEGADDVLAGYPWLKTARLLGALDVGNFRPGNLVRRWALRSNNRHVPWSQMKAWQDATGGPNGFGDMFGAISMTRHRFYSSSMWDRIDGHDALEDLHLDSRRMARWHPLNRGIYLGFKTFLPGLLMNQKGDRVAMRHGVQTRYPFLDDPLVEFLSRVDPRAKLPSLRRDKWLLRRYAAKMLPPEIAAKPKALFKAPLKDHFYKQPPEFVQQLLSDESLARTGYFDPAAVNDARQKQGTYTWARGKKLVDDMGLTGVMATQLWHHIFLGGGLCHLPTWSPAKPSHRELAAV